MSFFLLCVLSVSECRSQSLSCSTEEVFHPTSLPSLPLLPLLRPRPLGVHGGSYVALGSLLLGELASSARRRGSKEGLARSTRRILRTLAVESSAPSSPRSRLVAPVKGGCVGMMGVSSTSIGLSVAPLSSCLLRSRAMAMSLAANSPVDPRSSSRC
jgi:hypothetical protein